MTLLWKAKVGASHNSFQVYISIIGTPDLFPVFLAKVSYCLHMCAQFKRYKHHMVCTSVSINFMCIHEQWVLSTERLHDKDLICLPYYSDATTYSLVQNHNYYVLQYNACMLLLLEQVIPTNPPSVIRLKLLVNSSTEICREYWRAFLLLSGKQLSFAVGSVSMSHSPGKNPSKMKRYFG